MPTHDRWTRALAARGRPRHLRPMSSQNLFVLLAIGAVAVVLLLGLVNMMRGGSPNRSQELMRWRVLLQFAAVVAIMGVIWWRAV